MDRGNNSHCFFISQSEFTAGASRAPALLPFPARDLWGGGKLMIILREHGQRHTTSHERIRGHRPCGPEAIFEDPITCSPMPLGFCGFRFKSTVSGLPLDQPPSTLTLLPFPAHDLWGGGELMIILREHWQRHTTSHGRIWWHRPCRPEAI